MSARKPRRGAAWARDSADALFTDGINDDDSQERWRRAVQAREEEQERLHRTVVASKKQNLELQYERVAKQRAYIRREKRKLLLQHALLASERERFDASRSSDWFCLAAFPSVTDRRVTVDVGGQLFELSASVASKDPASLLAAFLQNDSPLGASESGCFRVDRDWRLFRHILRFLRDGFLPSDPKLLRDLYVESEYWRFESLLKAIETKNLELWQLNKSDTDAKLDSKTKAASESKDPNAWWLEPPAWWGAGSKPKEKPTKSALLETFRKKKSSLNVKAKLKAQKTGKDDEGDSDTWWKNSTYKGTNYMDILAKDKSKSADDGRTPRSPLVTHNTWEASTMSKK